MVLSVIVAYTYDAVFHCSKAITMFGHDERFNAVERPKEREDLFELSCGATKEGYMI